MDIAHSHTTFGGQALARTSFTEARTATSAPRGAPLAAIEAAVDPDRGTRFGEHAARDLPASVGWMIVAAYASILAAFAWAFFGAADVMFNIGVCAVYLAVYLGVPWIFLKGEPNTGKMRRPDFAEFLEQGLSTWTGHVSGSSALTQMLTIPVAVAFAALGLGIIIRVSA